MKVERYKKGDTERKILIGMITDRLVLSRIANVWQHNLLQSDWSNLIGGWCVEHFEKYGVAPVVLIEEYFKKWARKSQNEDLVRPVNEFLGALSGEYDREHASIQPDALIGLAEEYLNSIALKRFSDEMQDLIDDGDEQRALELRDKQSKIVLTQDESTSVFSDESLIHAAFRNVGQSMISFGDRSFDEFAEDRFNRSCFIAFWGPEKSGKTWWLIETAWRAMTAGLRVAYFEAGDMARAQIVLRFLIRAARHPKTAKTIYYPRAIYHGQDDTIADVKWKIKEFQKNLTPERALRAAQRLMQEHADVDQRFRLWNFSNSSLTVSTMQSILDQAAHRGWVPDVVIVDYADILATEQASSTFNSRDQINHTWKRMRALSQERDCLLVTATQADAASYDAKIRYLTKENFSEDKRKLAHPTGVIGINVTEQEKQIGVTRLNWVAVREGEFQVSRCLHVAGCLDVAQVAVCSTW
jgi:hypothetical protein